MSDSKEEPSYSTGECSGESVGKRVRGQVGTFLAPVLDKSPLLVTAEVTIAGVRVVSLVDTGATSSCCRWGWYKKWKSHLGPLMQTSSLVIGIGNVPVEVKGVSQPLELEWDSVRDKCQLMVLTKLEIVDVILGMDVLSQLNIQISARNKEASPHKKREICATFRLDKKVQIPAGKSRVFFLENCLKTLTLFEPSDSLPKERLGILTLSQGSKVPVQLDNLSEKDVLLNPEWEIGRLYSVDITDSPKTGHLPKIPNSLSFEQKEDLRQLLKEYKDVFSKEGDPISSTSLVEHEIHTEGPPVRLPFRWQNPIVGELEQSQIKEMLKDGVVRPSASPWASPVVMVKKKGWLKVVLCKLPQSE